MVRLLLVLALAAICLALLLAIAPYLLVVALAILVLAWRRPAALERVTASPRLEPVPESVRSTPMRFAASLVAVTFTLTAASAAFAGNRSGEANNPTPQPEVTRATDPVTTPSVTAEPTAAPTAAPTATASASPRPTPTPRPTPKLGSEPTGPTETGTVVKVIDGDTIDVDVDGIVHRVRYIGMDTPETHNGYEWMGAEAAAANGNLVAGRQVVLEKDVSETDQYGRLLRYVWVEDGSGWLLVNLELIRRGFATVATFPPDVKYIDSLFVAAERRAEKKDRGLWGATPTPVPTPVPTAAPIQPLVPQTNCDASYPDVCIPSGADLDCPEIAFRMFRVVPPDPHGFDADHDGVGCES